MTAPTRIQHLLDAEAGWQQRIGVTQLVRNLPSDRFACGAAALDWRALGLLAATGVTPHLLPRRLGLSCLSPARLRRYLLDREVDVAHAWSVPSAVTAAQAAAEVKLVVELFDPAVTDRQARMLRSIQNHPGFGVVCTSATIRRRLIEKGVSADVCTVIRPGIDFATINAARKQGVRRRLGIASDERTMLVPEPATRGGGQFTAYWAVAIRSFLNGRDHLVVPGVSPEQARIERLAGQLRLTSFLHCPGEASRFEELLANADVLLVPSDGDVPTTAIGWAMAAGVPVVATAVCATTELLSHDRTALLLKPDSRKRMAVKIAAMLDRREDLQMVREAARRQAYEAFGVGRYVDQHARLYQNLLHNQRPGEGIVAAAVS